MPRKGILTCVMKGYVYTFCMKFFTFLGLPLFFSCSSESIKYGTGTEPIEKMIERKIERYLSYALQDMQLVAGAYDFLQELKKNQKYSYALTTSGRKYQQEKILAKFNLDGFFDIMTTSEDVQNGKPHPEPYAVTVKKLKMRADECLVIEDSENGILSAKAAGCQVFGIETTFNSDQLRSAGADMVVSDFFELSKMLFN